MGELLPLDEILRARTGGVGVLFRHYQEGFINFPPTYKFVVGGDANEHQLGQSGTKARVPSWCDRVFFRGPVHILKYDHIPSFNQSDHKPVFAVLELNRKDSAQPHLSWWTAVNIKMKFRQGAEKLRSGTIGSVETTEDADDGGESD